MERLRSSESQRTFFNPKAATFSPNLQTEPLRATDFKLPGTQQLAAGDMPLAQTPSRKLGALDNQLIAIALDKALTADALAEYLRNQDKITMASSLSYGAQECVVGVESPERLAEARKVVYPPPGFTDEASRKILVDESSWIRPGIVSPSDNSTNLVAFGGERARRTSQPLIYTPHHSHGSSSGRRMRSYTRTKRSDQGPEPSAADIYPDDANWVQLHTQFNFKPAYHRQSFVAQLSPMRQLKFNDRISWPTPAEVYNQPTLQDSYTNVPEHEPVHGTDNDEQHAPITKEELNSADGDVLATISELPSLSVATILRLGVFDLSCDGRPLSPDQEDGMRYGMRFHGLAIGDEWLPRLPRFVDSSNAYPVDDGGWSGYSW